MEHSKTFSNELLKGAELLKKLCFEGCVGEGIQRHFFLESFSLLTGQQLLLAR